LCFLLPQAGTESTAGSAAAAQANAGSVGGFGGGLSYSKASAASGGLFGGSRASAESFTLGKKLLAVPARPQGNRKMLRGVPHQH